ncbi:type II toxin-antitoxin system prevent-host-death family antitoxin [Ilumatobacter fluminis]|uniref:type II toxin-antitoxin system prevent-host-death family antitoxin n=1 Tax=Ilumatobacter fluminis TaxID=467091 RepID=UPI003C7E20DC
MVRRVRDLGTDAARKFADLLDAVEHDGERYTITRRGRAVAFIEPVTRGGGGRQGSAGLRRSGVRSHGGEC